MAQVLDGGGHVDVEYEGGVLMAETMSGTAIRWLLDNKREAKIEILGQLLVRLGSLIESGEATSDIIGLITYVSEELETLYYVQD